jgi:hypothetical protein
MKSGRCGGPGHESRVDRVISSTDRLTIVEKERVRLLAMVGIRARKQLSVIMPRRPWSAGSLPAPVVIVFEVMS